LIANLCVGERRRLLELHVASLEILECFLELGGQGLQIIGAFGTLR